MKTKMFKWPLVLATVSLLALGSCKKEKDEELIIKKEQADIALSQSTELSSCAAPEYLQMQLAQDPAMKGRMDAIENDIQHRMASRSATTGIITIPVVVHVIYNTAAQNISDAQVLSQITVLNQDFARTNSDAANTPSVFQSLAANTGIQFCLAKRDPSGNATTGIVRKATNVTSWSSNGTVKMSSQGGDDAWPSGQYLNIWVCNLATYLGYATYPGGNPLGDGVVIRYSAFGNTGTVAAPYNKGRTATHEIGHWLNVYHIWGDGTCGNDLVADCPSQQAPNYGNPVFPHLSNCTGNAPTGDMFMNYMDYSNDASMNMFSLGQSSRMNAALSVARASILTSLGGVPPSGSATACNTPGGLSSASITATSATLSWASTGAVSYNVKYKPTSSSTWISVSSTSASAAVSGLSASTSYEFQVQSVCSGSSSLYSVSTGFTTAALPAACNIPGGLSSSSITTNSATLSWVSTGAVSYNVRYKATASSTWITATSSTTSRSVSGLSASTSYEFQVQSVCSGSSSSYSASATFTTSAVTVACNIPGGIYSSAITTNSATFSWASTGAVSYNVRYKATASSTWITATSSTTSRSVSGLSASTPYEFQVQSICSGGSSAYSASAGFTTTAPAGACNVPGGLSCLSVGATLGIVSWSSTGALSYNIRYKAVASSTWVTTSTTSTSRGLMGLSAATNYEYQVQSVCSGGSSSYSASGTFRTSN